MADISELHSASVTKLVGANNTTGIEDNFVDADSNGNLKVVDYSTSTTGVTVPSNASYIAGKNPSGNLTPVSIASNNDLRVQSSINTSLINGAISVNTIAIEAKVGATRLISRQAILITPTNGVVYFGSSATVTISTGTPIFKNQSYPILATDNIPIYLISATTIDVRIVEAS